MKMFDPLEHVVASENVSTSNSVDLESNSGAMDNSDPSTCPKCSQSMSLQGLDSKESVFFCTTCRVSSPQLVG